jgi:hypothetical protein
MLPSAYTPQVQHSLQAEESVHAFNSITEVELERSCVQVLVATPGRLVSHMLGTPGFTLRHLRFLVGGSMLLTIDCTRQHAHLPPAADLHEHITPLPVAGGG